MTAVAFVPLALMLALVVDAGRVSTAARVKIGSVSSVQGLWPFGLCADNSAIAAWIAAGFPDNVSATITFAQPCFASRVEPHGGDVSRQSRNTQRSFR